MSFQQVLLEARRELARHYLAQPTLELNEAAYLLGFGKSELVLQGIPSLGGHVTRPVADDALRNEIAGEGAVAPTCHAHATPRG